VAESEPKAAREPTYLQRVMVADICFLQGVLYWVAFGRLPIDVDFNIDDLLEYYETRVPDRNGELTEDECERAGLPRDPRLNYGWAGDVMLSDQIDDIVASYSREMSQDHDEMSQDHEEARRQAKTLFEEMTEWKPKFERAIEPAAAEVYLALRKGRLTSHGVRLPDPNDVAVSVKLMAEQNKERELDSPVVIPNDFWSPRNIYWELSAARNETEHYCHINCSTDEVMTVFPIDTVTTGESVDGLMQHGSFFVLSPSGCTNALPPARQLQPRGRRSGRPRLYLWDYLHLEMAGLVHKGLPAKREAAAAYLQEIYRRKFGDQVPAVRTLLEMMEPYYERYLGK